MSTARQRTSATCDGSYISRAMAETTPTAEQILGELAPAKSKDRYDQAWEAFLAFLKTEDKENYCPTEDDYICYFHRLHKNKGFKSSSLWLTHSLLNNNHQRIFGERLQKWSCIQLVLKHYEVGCQKNRVHLHP